VTHNDNKQVFRVGLTGGIASGKTTVANMFAELGVPVIDTDVIAREMVEPGTPALEEIRARFGDAIIDTIGALDRSALRRQIFSDDTARLDLEAILHPRIGAETQRQADVAGGRYQIIVVPLLVDSPLLQFVDRVLVVDCNEDEQLQRLLARDAETIGQARRILSAQASREDRLAIADDVITNDQDMAQTLEQVAELHLIYLNLVQNPYPTGRYPENS
jgi:dephospho-CoA kinase